MMVFFGKKTVTIAFIVKDTPPSEQGLIGLDKLAQRVIIASVGANPAAKQRAKDFGCAYLELPSGTGIGSARNKILEEADTTWVLYLQPFDVLSPDSHKDFIDIMGKKGDAFVLYKKHYTKKEKNALLPGFIPNTGSSMERGSGYLLSGELCMVRNKKDIQHDALGDPTASINLFNGDIGEANYFIHDYQEFENPTAKDAATISELQKRADEAPNARTYFELACAHVHAKNHDAALQAFAKANEFDKNNIDVLNNLGITFFNAGQRAKAIKILLAALKIHPDKATNFNNPYPFSNIFATIGTVFKEQGEFKKAIVAYEKAIRMGHPDKGLLQAHVDGMNRNLENRVQPNYQFSAGFEK